jgi:hypothetical protein
VTDELEFGGRALGRLAGGGGGGHGSGPPKMEGLPAKVFVLALSEHTGDDIIFNVLNKPTQREDRDNTQRGKD